MLRNREMNGIKKYDEKDIKNKLIKIHFNSVCVCMHVYMYTKVHTFQNMLKSEHNISECVISFYHVGTRA